MLADLDALASPHLDPFATHPRHRGGHRRNAAAAAELDDVARRVALSIGIPLDEWPTGVVHDARSTAFLRGPLSRARCGFADDEGDRHQLRDRQPAMLERRQEEVDTDPTQIVRSLGHGGEARVGDAGERSVVETDNTDIVGHLHARRPQLVHQEQCGLVVVADDDVGLRLSNLGRDRTEAARIDIVGSQHHRFGRDRVRPTPPSVRRGGSSASRPTNR